MDNIDKIVLKEMQEYAQMYFEAIIEANTTGGECQLKPGKYSAKELEYPPKAACGAWEAPKDEIFDEDITIVAESFKCRFPYRSIFSKLTQWETLCRAGKRKAIFEIGEVEEKSAKILVDEKTALGAYATKGMKVQRVTGNWWMPRKLSKNGDAQMFYELNGVMSVPGLTFFAERIKDDRKSVVERCAGIGDEEIKKLFLSFLAKNPDARSFGYFKEVARLVNLDTQSKEAVAIMEEAKEEKRKRDEEEARELAEQKARAEETRRKRMEEEERIKRKMAESLAKAKEDFVSGKMIRREDFEDIVRSIGYEINIRTLGTLRKRITWIEVKDIDDVTVYGTKTRRGLDGTFAMIREVYALAKAQSEKETPKHVRHISAIMETCRTWDDEKRDYTDEYKYYTWLANHIPEHKTTNKNTTELILEEVRERISAAATLAAHGVPKCDIEGAVCAVVNRLAKVEDILQFYSHTEPPQSPTTPTDIQNIKPQKKHARAARKEPKRRVRRFRTTETRTIRSRLIVGCVPRRCSTAHHFAGVSKMIAVPPDYAPPIRGDCKIRRSVRAKPPNSTKIGQISNLKPP